MRPISWREVPEKQDVGHSMSVFSMIFVRKYCLVFASPTACWRVEKKLMQTKRRDPQRTKSNLLGAGVELFAKRGYHGVSVDEIVNLAGCNKRMLYHYFGSKDGLYVQVLGEVFQKLESLEILVFDSEIGLDKAIALTLENYFRFLDEHPEFVSLLLWENLNKGRFLDSHPGLLTKTPVLHQLAKVLDQARKRGEIRRKINATHLLLLLYGACFIYHSNRYTLRHTVNLKSDRRKALQEARLFIGDVITKGLLSD
jgi:AcrR family transcriptional regulator